MPGRLDSGKRADVSRRMSYLDVRYWKMFGEELELVSMSRRPETLI